MPGTDTVPVPSADLAGEALHKFLRINRYLRQYARQVNEHGLPPRQFSVLRRLLEEGPATVGTIQDYLYSSASVASTVISQLEDAGYVTRTRSADDNRVVIVALSQAGHELAQNTPMGGIVLLRRKLASLPEARLRTIDAALADIMELMGVPDEE